MAAGESANKCQNPGEKIDADLMGPTDETVNKERYAFVTKDEASNYLKAAGIVSKEATSTRDAMLKLYGQLAQERQRLAAEGRSGPTLSWMHAGLYGLFVAPQGGGGGGTSPVGWRALGAVEPQRGDAHEAWARGVAPGATVEFRARARHLA